MIHGVLLTCCGINRMNSFICRGMVVCLLWLSPVWADEFAGGTGTTNDPYRVATGEHLHNVRNHKNAHFLQTEDINLKDFSEYWGPIGSSGARFTGSYDGGGYRIYGLDVAGGAAYRGLFGFAEGASFRRINLEVYYVRGTGYAGALVGRVLNSRIEDVTVIMLDEGYVSTGSDYSVAGGLAGSASSTIMDNISIAGRVYGHSKVGGVVGEKSGGTLHRATVNVEVTAWGNETGGLIGDSSALIYSSRAVGSVDGNERVGGLVGRQTGGSIISSYSRAAVTGDSHVGGAAGRAGQSGALFGHFYRVYAAGTVTGTNDVGGLLGSINVSCTAFDSYWDMESSGQTNSAVGEGRTTAEMRQQETYRQYNFYTLWQIDEGNDYPVFQDLSGYSQPEDLTLDDLAGDGTPGNPYLITTASELNAMRLGLTNHFRLANDIDLADTVIWNEGSGWQPVGDNANRFKGSFDGAGYTIKHLTVNRPRSHYQGLFGDAQDADIRSVRLEQVSVHGLDYCGGISGHFRDCDIEDIIIVGEIRGRSRVGGLVGSIYGGNTHRATVDGKVAGHVNYIGGIAGEAVGGATFYLTRSLGSVSGNNYVGGLFGLHSIAYTVSSYSRADVQGANHVGGAIGRAGTTTHSVRHIFRVYSSGAVDGTEDVGGFIGSRSTNCDVYDSYWDMEASGQTNSAHGEGRTTAEMLQRDTYRHYNFHTLWEIDEGNDYPVFRDWSGYHPPGEVTLDDLDGDGTPGSPYLITTASELNAMRLGLTNHFRLANNIDLSDSVIWNQGRGWEPIGTSADRFRGTFDGAGHRIAYLSVNNPYIDFVGLFGYVQDATIKDVLLDDIHVHGWNRSAGVVGRADTSEIEDVAVYGDIVGVHYVGGAAGILSGGSLRRLAAEASVYGRGAHVGGLAGHTLADVAIERCYAVGAVEGDERVGGLIGRHERGAVEDCYSRGPVSGTRYVGAAFGHTGGGHGVNGNVARSYSTGAVDGEQDVGGFVGYHERGTIGDSYWDIDTSGQTSSAAGEGRTTEEMTYPHDAGTTYLGWNFDTVWANEGMAVNDGYPWLREAAPVRFADMTVSVFWIKQDQGDESTTCSFKVEMEAPWIVTARFLSPSNEWYNLVYDAGGGLWEYEDEADTLAELEELYSSGDYLFELEHIGGTSTTIVQVAPSLVMPAQAPDITHPEEGMLTTKEVLLTWNPVTDSHVNRVLVLLSGYDALLDKDSESFGPVLLTAGDQTARVAFLNGFFDQRNSDGVLCRVAMGQRAEVPFAVGHTLVYRAGTGGRVEVTVHGVFLFTFPPSVRSRSA